VRSPQSLTLLFVAYVAVAVVRAALTLLPSRVVLRGVARTVDRALARAGATGADSREAVRVAKAVRVAARRVPAASCLTQALAGQLLLATRGLRSRLRVGVRRDPGGEFHAHAWLESDYGVVLGGGALHRFARLPDLTGSLR
jgi:hypothetical protein